MAIETVRCRICDFCKDEAVGQSCILCHKDFCFRHGDRYTPGDRTPLRHRLALCDICAVKWTTNETITKV